MQKLLILLPLIILILASAYLYFNPVQRVTSNPTPTPLATTTPLPSQDTQSVTGPLNSYTISIPNGFAYEPEGEFSRRIVKDVPAQGQGSTSFIYLSVIPQKEASAESTIYNYNQTDFNKMIRSQQGNKIVLGDANNADLASYFTYIHGDGRMIGGYGAKSFVNTKPWEFPAGTTEYRYIVEFANTNYLIGAYLTEDTSSPYYISQQEFDQILSTLKLTPEEITDDTPVTNGQTKTFNSAQHKLTFAYPADWTPRETLEPEQIFAIYKIGTTQRGQTELYDGASFGAYEPIPAPVDLKAWMKEKYETSQQLNEPAVYGQYSANNVTYETIKVCGLGCFNYYHTIQNGKLYRFMLMATGPQEKQYTETLQKIINTATYLK